MLKSVPTVQSFLFSGFRLFYKTCRLNTRKAVKHQRQPREVTRREVQEDGQMRDLRCWRDTCSMSSMESGKGGVLT